jgi:hypothetical protein
MLEVNFFSEIDLFKQLPDSCLEALARVSNVLNCSAGHLFFQPEQTGRVRAFECSHGRASRRFFFGLTIKPL